MNPFTSVGGRKLVCASEYDNFLVEELVAPGNIFAV